MAGYCVKGDDLCPFLHEKPMTKKMAHLENTKIMAPAIAPNDLLLSVCQREPTQTLFQEDNPDDSILLEAPFAAMDISSGSYSAADSSGPSSKPLKFNQTVSQNVQPQNSKLLAHLSRSKTVIATPLKGKEVKTYFGKRNVLTNHFFGLALHFRPNRKMSIRWSLSEYSRSPVSPMPQVLSAPG